ncbi:MAG: hypothetical protein U0521_29035 [Anaerolineae bacterium]
MPDTVVASQVHDRAPTIRDMIAKIQAGEMGGTAYNLTLENGGLTFAYGAVELPAEVKDAADAAVAGIISGDITVLRNCPKPRRKLRPLAR